MNTSLGILSNPHRECRRTGTMSLVDTTEWWWNRTQRNSPNSPMTLDQAVGEEKCSENVSESETSRGAEVILFIFEIESKRPSTVSQDVK
jgi:hypothetical protein